MLVTIFLLGAIIGPRVLLAMTGARLSHVVGNVESVQTAAVEYFGKYGRFGGIGGAAMKLPLDNWDAVLVAENLLEHAFDPRLGDTPNVQVAVATKGGAGGAFCYKLDGEHPLPEGSYVVVASLNNVPLADAWELSRRVDGKECSTDSLVPGCSQSAPNQAGPHDPSAKLGEGGGGSGGDWADDRGRVIYTMPKEDQTVTVSIYLLHQ